MTQTRRKISLSICIVLLLVLVLGLLSACQGFGVSYAVDTAEFSSTIAKGDSVDLTGLKLKVTLIGTNTIEVTEAMVISCDATDTVGEKTLVFQYADKEFEVKFFVKYNVQFEVDGEIISQQLVLTVGEIELPENPSKEGFTFEGWTPAMPETLEDNVVFQAQFVEESGGGNQTPPEVDPPQLSVCNATYGDTLSSIELPFNHLGSWQFVDDLTTMVGNAGRNSFDVKFVYNDASIEEQTSVVSIDVAQKELSFENVVLSFVYDGESHQPTFDLIGLVNEDNVEVDFFGNENATEVGEYSFMLTVISPNYTGSYVGSFEIEKLTVTVDIENVEIDYEETLPNFTYQTNSTLSSDLLGISINVMKGQQIVTSVAPDAGEYLLTATTNNTNIVLDVDEASLVINKIVYHATKAELSVETQEHQVYGNTLSQLKFVVDANGRWDWQNENLLIGKDKDGKFTATAVFTPQGATATNYLSTTCQVTFEVAKRTVTLVVDVTSGIYNGQQHVLSYKVLDGTVDVTDQIDSVSGLVVGTNAGDYSNDIEIVDENYKGSATVLYTIEKANPTPDFSKVYDVIYGDAVSSIQLENGYRFNSTKTTFDEVGQNQQWEATYTPEDTSNFNTIIGYFTINVSKANASIENVELSYNKIYTGEVFTIENIRTSHTESLVVFTYTIDGEEVSEIKNAGTYVVTITLPQTDHFNEVVVSTTFIVEKATITDTNILAQTGRFGQTLS